MSMSSFNLLQSASLHFDTPGLSTVRQDFVRSEARAVELKQHLIETDVASTAPLISRPIDPMLLVYQERVQTFRLLARWISEAVRRMTAGTPVAPRHTPGRQHIGDAANVGSGAM